MSIKYTITQSRLLYVLTINDRKHANLLKVGEVFVDNEVADSPNKQVLFKAVCRVYYLCTKHQLLQS